MSVFLVDWCHASAAVPLVPLSSLVALSSLERRGHSLWERAVQLAFVEPASKALDRMPASQRHLVHHLLAPDPHKRLTTLQARPRPGLLLPLPLNAGLPPLLTSVFR